MTTFKSALSIIFISIISILFVSENAHAQYNFPASKYSYHTKPTLKKYTKLKPISTQTISFQPDLVVTYINATGPAVRNRVGNYELPIRVKVKNIGNRDAGQFKVAVYHSCYNGDCPTYYRNSTYVISFHVPGKGSWYPFVNSLKAGKSVTLDGKLTFRNQGTYSIKAHADSGSGDEFMPEYIRVNESNENNNWSTPRIVSVRPTN